MITISGALIYRERIALLPGGSATISLIDMSQRESVATVIAETTIELGDQQVPIPFALPFDAGGRATPGSYAVSATISGPTNHLEWATATAHRIDLDRTEIEVGSLTLVRASHDNAGTADASPIIGQWNITAVNTTPVIADSAPTIVFQADGTLVGNASCNSYSTNYRTAGSLLSINSEIATTLMACDPATERQERALLAVLNTIAASTGRFELNPAGNELRLTASDGTTIIAAH